MPVKRGDGRGRIMPCLVAAHDALMVDGQAYTDYSPELRPSDRRRTHPCAAPNVCPRSPRCLVLSVVPPSVRPPTPRRVTCDA